MIALLQRERWTQEHDAGAARSLLVNEGAKAVRLFRKGAPAHLWPTQILSVVSESSASQAKANGPRTTDEIRHARLTLVKVTVLRNWQE